MKYTKVKSAKLHATYHTTGSGQLDKTLDPVNYTGMQLAYNGLTLQILYKGCKIGIPAAGVAGVTYFADEAFEWEQSKPVSSQIKGVA